MNKHWSKTILSAVLGLVITIVWVLPIGYLIFSSFQPSEVIARKEVSLNFTLANYRQVFERSQVLRYLVNSILVASLATVISIVLGIPAAYSMARWNTGGRGLAFWILSSRMMPPAVSIIPFFIMFSRLKIADTIPGLIIAHLTFSLAFIIWMARVFIEDIPIELEEAAQVDGANIWVNLTRIVLPLARPGLIATTVLNFVFSWNELLFSFALSLTEKSRTLPIVAGIFVTSYQIQWGPMFAAAVVIMLPILVLTFLVQRYLIGGLTMGALK